MPRLAVIISPNWHDYANKYLAKCIGSLHRQTRLADKIFLIDNETSEESFNLLKSLVPEGDVIRNAHNAGFAEGNNLAMAKALDEGFDYIVLLNMDTVSAPDALAELEKAAEENKQAGAIQAKLMLWREQDKINSIGNATHFLGFGFSTGYKEKLTTEKKRQDNKIFYPSGAAVLYKAETLKKIGLFDEFFWMYAEDQDLGWRIWLQGEECLLAEKATVYHDYEFSRSIKKYFWMNRNRLLVILKNYHYLTLIAIAPAWLIMEIGQLFFAWRGGWLKLQIAVYWSFFKPSLWRYLARARQKVQTSRKVKDSQIKYLLQSKISYQEIDSSALRLANLFFNLYWRLVKPMIIW